MCQLDGRILYGLRAFFKQLIVKVIPNFSLLFPMGALIDPCPQQTDLLLGQRIALILGRHLHFLDQPRNIENHGAFRAFTRYNGRTSFPAFHRSLFLVHTEPTHPAIRVVAIHARFLENGLNVFCKRDLLWGNCGQFRGIRCLDNGRGFGFTRRVIGKCQGRKTSDTKRGKNSNPANATCFEKN